MSNGPDLISSAARDLTRSGFSRHIVAGHSSLGSKSGSDSLHEHCDDLLGSFLGDDPTNFLGRVVDSFSRWQTDRLHNIWFHVDSAVRKNRVGSRHLQGCRGNSLSERHGEKLRARPLFVWIDPTIHLAFEGNVGSGPESEIIDVFMEKSSSDLLNNRNHPDVTAPVERVKVGMMTNTLTVDVADFEVVDRHVSLIGIGIGRGNIARIESDRDRNRLENRPRLIERPDGIIDVRSRTETIFIAILRYSCIGTLPIGRVTQEDLAPLVGIGKSLCRILYEEGFSEKEKFCLSKLLRRESLDVVDGSEIIGIKSGVIGHSNDRTGSWLHDHDRPLVCLKLLNTLCKELRDLLLDVPIDRERHICPIHDTLLIEIVGPDRPSRRILLCDLESITATKLPIEVPFDPIPPMVIPIHESGNLGRNGMLGIKTRRMGFEDNEWVDSVFFFEKSLGYSVFLVGNTFVNLLFGSKIQPSVQSHILDSFRYEPFGDCLRITRSEQFYNCSGGRSGS